MQDTPVSATFCRPGGDSGAAGAGADAAGRDIRAIHALKTRLRLSDDDYRALLVQLTGCASSKDCTPAQRRQVREHLQRLAERAGLAAPRPPLPAASARERKVWALWHQLHQVGLIGNHSAPALNAYVYRQVGVSALRFATPAQLDTLIESLKSWARRGQERLPQ